MYLRYSHLATNQPADAGPEVKTHTLTFRDESTPATTGPVGSQNAIVLLPLTAEEASAYQLGEMYWLTLQLVQVPAGTPEPPAQLEE